MPSPDDRLATLDAIINNRLSAAGLPPTPLNVYRDRSGRPQNRPPGQFGEYDQYANSGAGELRVNPRMITAGRISPDLVKTVYHEARHAEQWHRLAQFMAGGGARRPGDPAPSAAGLSSRLGMSGDRARAAMAAPQTPGSSPQAVFGQAMQRSFVGAGRDHRNGVLTDNNNNPSDINQARYESLVEEQDAWGVETFGDLANGCP